MTLTTVQVALAALSYRRLRLDLTSPSPQQLPLLSGTATSMMG